MNYLSGYQFDIVLMDVQMPAMPGFEAARTIRASTNCQNRNLPVTGRTAHTFSKDREKRLQAGMSDYLSKPVDPEKLSALLNK
ncbi:MAG: response regulator [Desulfobacteraceae bacterium]|nr:response regulator [Desulfobacteraceae bacterium]